MVYGCFETSFYFKLMNVKKYNVLGLMSGTSLDGLDLAYCIFIKKNNSWKFELKFVEFIEYDLIWKKKITDFCTMGNTFILGELVYFVKIRAVQRLP